MADKVEDKVSLICKLMGVRLNTHKELFEMYQAQGVGFYVGISHKGANVFKISEPKYLRARMMQGEVLVMVRGSKQTLISYESIDACVKHGKQAENRERFAGFTNVYKGLYRRTYEDRAAMKRNEMFEQCKGESHKKKKARTTVPVCIANSTKIRDFNRLEEKANSCTGRTAMRSRLATCA